MKLPIYLDHHATTPVDPRVVEAMLPCFGESFGNAASSMHPWGIKAGELVWQAREQLAKLIGGKPGEVVFTSGATEANNLALKGVCEQYASKGNHIISVTTEHKSVLDPLKHLEKKGFEVSYLGVNSEGLIDVEELNSLIMDKTILISVMLANNEIGVVQPLEEVGKIAKKRGVLLHSDAAQALGKISVDVQKLNVDLMSFSAHKMYGPKGVGALWVRSYDPKVHLVAQMHGGGQEEGVRSGTMNVPGIVGFGKACEIAKENLEEDIKRITELRNDLLEKFEKNLDEIRVNGSLEHRLPGNLNMSFEHTESDAVLLGLNQEVGASSGSACDSEKLEPSYVLKEIGLSTDVANAAIRFGIGRSNTREEIEYASNKVIEVVHKLRLMTKS